MRKIALFITAIGFGLAATGCGNSSERNSAEQDATEQSDAYLETERTDSVSVESNPMDSSYMQGERNADGEGGRVTETKGTFESGYGTGNNTELHPSTTGSDGTATGRGSEDPKADEK